MAIGETFLSAFLQVLFEQLLSAGGIQFLKLVGGVDLPKTIKKWKRRLTVLEALLDDAELQQFHSKPVRLWLNDLQDLAYDIQDLLDHFATDALGYQLKKAEEDEANTSIDHSNAGILDTMMQNIYASGSRAADSLSTFLKPVDQNIRDKIDDITERLQDIQDQTQSLILTAARTMQHQTRHTETLRSQRESTSLVGEVFGRDEKQNEIITLLLKDDQNAEGYVVIPIVGTGGIGKTTLAQYVYNDEQRYVYRDEQLYADEQHKSNFDLKAWVCISDVFDVKSVTIDIINSATHSNFNCSNLDQAQLKLQQVLNGKKFFIVLDDIWSEEYDDWYKLQKPFRHGAKGSRVIMTTRIENIAMMMVTNPTQHNIIIKLESLSKDDIWLIFQQHANVDPDLAEMRDNILEKINGLPLAAKALGGLLKSIPDKSQRRKILESNVWGEKSNVLPVLWLSYYHMPSHLKCVFAYCSMFPKDYQFREIEVVLLWMAQGFLPETRNERMEDIGHKYFNDLVSRSLFEKIPSEGRYIMHDLIHDVAQLSAGDVCYVMDANRDILNRTRHLFITKHVGTLGKLIMASQLRTFLCRNYHLRIDNLDLIQRMHYMRALRLVSNQIEVLPDCIGDLKHLRYLSLGFPRIKVLPQSINNLWNLQLLCVNDCDELEKVPYIGSLEKLRHMYIIHYPSMMKLGHSLFMESPPLKEMPLGIGKLTNLQTLGRFVLAPRGESRVRELGKLDHLRGNLFISGVEYVTEVEDAQEAQLHKKECLVDLHLKWGSCTDEVDDMTKRGVIEMLQPHTNINKCGLDGYMGSKFPSWLGDPSFSSMVDITLKMCEKCECLPPLGQLPSLKSLRIEKINSIKEVGLEFYGHCSSPFPSLKTLSIHLMNSWEKWVHPDNKAFPILVSLSIKDCPSLQGDLPPHLPSLTRMEIHRCESMVSIGHIPLTLKSFVIDDCETLGCVEFDDQSTNLSGGSDDKKALQSEESLGVSQKASLELPLLFRFRIISCPSLRSLQQSLLLPGVQSFELENCKNMDRLPAQLLNITSLRDLRIHQCPEIHSLAEGGLPRNLTSLSIINVNIKQGIQGWGLHLLHSLKTLVLKNVGSLVDSVECIPSPHLSLPSSLSTLELEGFHNLKSICYGTTLPNLYYLDVSVCPSLKSLVIDFTSLSQLLIKDCPIIYNFPVGGLPTKLMRLSISETKIDKPIKHWGFHLFISLNSLTLENVGSCANTIESIGYPDFPSSLSSLKLKGFQNLKTICCSTLPNLDDIYIKCCPKLESFGYNALPSHIERVYIEECGMIEQHLRSDPNGRIKTENGTFSLLSENQPSLAHSST